jgi:tetrapyrrole methylase family protein/MazG family protein
MVEFETICDKVDELIASLGGYWPDEWLIHPVIEELGEFSKELQIRVGLHRNKKSSNKKLQEEFGDLLFAVLALGKGLKINVEEAILQTIEKYHKRDG